MKKFYIISQSVVDIENPIEIIASRYMITRMMLFSI